MGSRYGTVQNALIEDWRQHFHDAGDMPFYFVQLPAFGHDRQGRGGEFRAAQAVALELKNTGMVITNDIGEPDNVHPKNKRDVGRRLALQALRKTYGCQDIVADGPVFHALTLKDGRLHITFTNCETGLQSRDGKPLSCFEIAGADGKFVSADATLDANEVIVVCPAVAEPKIVRFAWGDGDMPNLMSKEGLPAGQFRAEVQ
jgi:sialate O-acetylesterase